jgi:hypothetical protein
MNTMMKIMMITPAAASVLFFATAQHAEDKQSIFWYHIAYGRRVGVLWSRLEHDKNPISHSGSISFLWAPESDWYTPKEQPNRPGTWPETVIVGKQYTAYVGQDYGASFIPVKAMIKGSVEDGYFIPNDAKVGDCWFVKSENLYKVLIIQKIPPNTPIIPQTLQDGGYRLFTIVEGMCSSPEKFASHGAPAPTE